MPEYYVEDYGRSIEREGERDLKFSKAKEAPTQEIKLPSRDTGPQSTLDLDELNIPQHRDPQGRV